MGDDRSPQYSSYRVPSMATAFGPFFPPSFQMEITPLLGTIDFIRPLYTPTIHSYMT